MPFVGALAWLVLCWLSVWIVDLRPDTGLASLLFPRFAGPEFPFLWIHLFEEASLTEQLQWLALLGGVGVALLGAYQSRHSRAELLTFLMFSLGLTLLYLEDAHNIRHVFSAWAGPKFFGVETSSGMEWRRSTLRMVLEMAVYLLLATVMLGALVLVRRAGASRCIWIWFVMAYSVYGVAALASVTRNWGDWYARLGAILYDRLSAEGSTSYHGNVIVYSNDPIGFWFLDLLFEESLELVGAAMLTSVLLWLRRDWRLSP